MFFFIRFFSLLIFFQSIYFLFFIKLSWSHSPYHKLDELIRVDSGYFFIFFIDFYIDETKF